MTARPWLPQAFELGDEYGPAALRSVLIWLTYWVDPERGHRAVERVRESLEEDR